MRVPSNAWITRVAVLTGAALISTAPARAAAQSASVRQAVIDTVALQLTRHYVSADTGARIARLLQERYKAGAYDSATTPARFAELLTDDMRKVNGDLHLSVRYAPSEAPYAMRPDARGIPMDTEALREMPVLGARDRDGRLVDALPNDLPPMLADAIRQNYGLGRVEILPGNVGYIEINGFLGAPGAEEAIAAALRFVEKTDALIIDVRRNNGGSSVMSHAMLSHFLPASAVPTIQVDSRSSGASVTQRSFTNVVGPRRTDVPLFVLTSRGSYSAAEEFPFVLQHLRRATVIGERTAGAGHMVAALAAGNDFVVRVSYTRVRHPKTGAEWERTGVTPDLATDAALALDVAHAQALWHLAALQPARAGVLKRLAEAAEAKTTPRGITPKMLASVAGEYGGRIGILAMDGKLFYRPYRGELPDELIPLRDGRFAHGAARISFEGEGPSVRLVVEREDGRKQVYAKTS
jgi:hypothetical protein